MNHSFLKRWHQRLFAWGMAKANNADDRAIKLHDYPDCATMADLKRSLLSHLQGTVLEIGPGAGANLSYYPPDIHWIGVEPNPFMHPYIHQEAELHRLTEIELYGEQAETLPVADNSIDTVVSTYVLCSVTDIDATLKDIQRVLKPGGTFVFIIRKTIWGSAVTAYLHDLGFMLAFGALVVESLTLKKDLSLQDA